MRPAESMPFLCPRYADEATIEWLEAVHEIRRRGIFDTATEIVALRRRLRVEGPAMARRFGGEGKTRAQAGNQP